MVETSKAEVCLKSGCAPIGFDEASTGLLMKRLAVGPQTRLEVSKPVLDAGRQV